MKRILLAGVFAFLLMLCSCTCNWNNLRSETEQVKKTTGKADSENKHEKSVLAMDTYMTLTAYGENGEKAIDQAVEEIERLDGLLSISSEEGDVYIVNENGSGIVSEDTGALVEKSLELYQITNGAFDITIYPLMKEWGFTDEHYKVPSADRLQRLLKKVDASAVRFDRSSRLLSLPDEVRIDFGGIAKGYASADVMEIFKKAGVKSGIISLGGNVQTLGEKPDGSLWKIGVKNPDTDSPAPYIGALETKNQAVITSGGYERFFEEDGKTYHHILNPKTGYPADSGLISVTIISGDGALADGLSTSIFVMGKKKGVALWKERSELFDMILQEEDGTLSITEGIEDKFTSELDIQVIRKNDSR